MVGERPGARAGMVNSLEAPEVRAAGPAGALACRVSWRQGVARRGVRAVGYVLMSWDGLVWRASHDRTS